jgi:hypothetical protein
MRAVHASGKMTVEAYDTTTHERGAPTVAERFVFLVRPFGMISPSHC